MLCAQDVLGHVRHTAVPLRRAGSLQTILIERIYACNHVLIVKCKGRPLWRQSCRVWFIRGVGADGVIPHFFYVESSSVQVILGQLLESRKVIKQCDLSQIMTRVNTDVSQGVWWRVVALHIDQNKLISQTSNTFYHMLLNNARHRSYWQELKAVSRYTSVTYLYSGV